MASNIPEAPLYGCIEAGGTKFVCAIAAGPGDIRARTRIPTTTPDETLARAIDWFAGQKAVRGFGVASFGPIELDPRSPRWGTLLGTPKTAWIDADMVAPLRHAFGQPIGLDTDVNGAALAEARWGASRDADVSVYVTVGTGIGGGMIVNGEAVHGRRHPEMGHFTPPRHPDDTGFAGVCPFHGDCLEGLASGPAIERRWRHPLDDLPSDHPAHRIIGWYLGQLAVTLTAVASPQRIVLGGGVMKAPGLIEQVRAAAAAIGAGYFTGSNDGDAWARTIVAPELGDDAGVLGALILAERAADRAKSQPKRPVT